MYYGFLLMTHNSATKNIMINTKAAHLKNVANKESLVKGRRMET